MNEQLQNDLNLSKSNDDLLCGECFLSGKFNSSKIEPVSGNCCWCGKFESCISDKFLSVVVDSFLDKELDGDGNIRKVRVSIPKCVDFLIKNNTFKTLYYKKSEEIFRYSEGIYLADGREYIHTKTEKILGEYATIRIVQEIVDKVKRQTGTSDEEFDIIPIDKICVMNGVLDLSTSKLEEFNPKYNFRNKIPVYFVKDAKCPKILNFFNNTFYPEDIPTIQEWFGFNLYKKYFKKKALILYGETDTSKTVVLTLLTKFVGEQNKTGVPLHRISSADKFASVSLKNKLSNIYDDLAAIDLNDAGGFKAACGGGNISAEYKFGDRIEFMNYAKHTFACNKIPIPKNVDFAYYSRMMPIPCDNQIPKDKQDSFLIEKLTTDEELSGLLNYALDGLQRLLKHEKFSFNKTVEEVKALLERNSNGLNAFVQECLVRKDGEKITKEQMFQCYRAYTLLKKFPILSKEQLGRQIKQVCPYIVAKRDSNRFWENANINWEKLDSDTLDTFTKIMTCTKEKINNDIHIISMKPSNVSNDISKDKKNLGIDDNITEESVQ